MKSWSWKQWTLIGVIVALVVTFVVLHLVQPQVSYAWLEICCSATFVLGGVCGWLLKDVIKK